MDVGGLFVPLEVHGLLDLQRVPSLGALADLAVGVQVNLRLDDRVLEVLDLLPRGPQLSQVDVLPVPVLGDGLGLEVDVDCACDGEGHNERWRGEEVGLRVGMHPPLEIAVSGEH